MPSAKNKHIHSHELQRNTEMSLDRNLLLSPEFLLNKETETESLTSSSGTHPDRVFLLKFPRVLDLFPAYKDRVLSSIHPFLIQKACVRPPIAR